MSIPVQPWFALYERLSLALETALGGDYREMRRRRNQSATELLSARCAVNAALSDALESWNNAHPDALQLLPIELAHDIFRQLGFRDRIAVSHVSHSWRAAALADPFLWNSAVFARRHLVVYYPHPGGRFGVRHPPSRDAILGELLARSAPVSFSLKWERAVLPEEILEIVLQNLHRIQRLAVDLYERGFQQLFTHPAPQLVSLTCTSDSDDFLLPLHWDAPQLQKLALSTVRLPVDGEIQRLVSVTEFNCFELHGLEQRGMSLFAIFPALTSLEIRVFWPEMLPYLADPPATLTALTLRTDDGLPIDFSQLLEACRTCRLKLLCLDCIEDLVPVLALFTSLVAGTWTMNIDPTGYRIQLASDEGDVLFTAFPDEPLSFSRSPRLASYLRRVSALTAPVRILGELDRLAQWDRSLPVLRDLTIAFTQRSAGWLPSGLSPLRVPILQSVSVVGFGPERTAASWAFEGLPAVLQSCFVYARPLLESVSIVTESTKGFSEKGLADLRALSKIVIVKLGNETTEYSHHPVTTLFDLI